MASPSPHGVTRLLKAWTGGEQEAYEQLVPLVYHELHRLAHRYMARERHGHTLQSVYAAPWRIQDRHDPVLRSRGCITRPIRPRLSATSFRLASSPPLPPPLLRRRRLRRFIVLPTL